MKKNLCLTMFLILLSVTGIVQSASVLNPLTMAHRGGFVETEENTLKAYNNAIDHGINIIECDPKITKDGKWIIMHDPTVDRTTNGKGIIADLTFDQIRALRTKGGEPIPTLEEVLDLGKQRNTIVFLDMHFPPPDLKAFFAIVDAHGMTGQIVVNTWVKPFQIELNKLRPEIQTCFPWPKPIPSLKKLKEMGVNYVGTIPQLATKGIIKKCHKLGMKVVTMPINDKAKIQKFIAKGLDVIQTDDPRLTEGF